MYQFPQDTRYFNGISIIEYIENAQFQAYLVGGCVRDVCLARPIQDYDICTSAPPEELLYLFPDAIETGIAYGTITLVREKIPYEITTFRGEGQYGDGRHPDEIVFLQSLEEDLQRRDFTMNAMAYHPKEGIIDPFQGQHDLKKGLIRTVGDPFTRFSEDYLRILRALRFSATLGLDIQRETGDAMLSTWEGLHQVTRERLSNEIKKLVMGRFCEKIHNFYPIFEEGIFGLDCLWDAEDELHFVEKLREISTAPPISSLRLALFLSLFSADSSSLRLSKQEGKEVDFLCGEPCLAWEKQEYFHDLIHKYGRDKVELLLFYQKCNFPYHRQELEALETQLQGQACTSLQELAITGSDLLQQGVQEGAMVGKLLHIALDLVLQGVVGNEKEALLSTILGEKREEIP